jgi:amino acid adenylation domain-containing protein
VIAESQIERSYPLAPMQLGMLYHSLSAANGAVYVSQVVSKLPPDMDHAAFEKAWQSVINRHAVLRTSFLWHGLSEPLQRVNEGVSLPIDIQDWTNIPASGKDDLLKSYLLRERSRGFDLSTPPLMRLALLKVAGDGFLFIWTHHHMLLDGRSRVIVMKEVSLFYEAYRRNRDLELPRPPAYADYIDWFYRQDRSAADEYWVRLLSTFRTPVKVELPKESNPVQSEEIYQTAPLNLSAEVKASLQLLARSNKLTVNLIVQAAWAALLARYSGQDEVVFGETRACRRPEFEKAGSVVGVLMNTVPIRLHITGSKTFLELLHELRDQHVAMRPHECTPLARIRECGVIDRTAELFQSIVVFEEYNLGSALQREECDLWRGGVWRVSPAHYPLTLAGYSKPELSIQIEYDRRAYSDKAMERLAGHLATLLEGVTRNPQARVADLPLLTNAEEQALKRWNQTDADYAEGSCIHQLFEEQAARTPEAVAVVFGDAVLSYGELNRRSNQLTHHLRGMGVGADMRVAILLERSIDLVIAQLAVLKCGAAYAPIDPTFPDERQVLMVADCAARVVITTKSATLPKSLVAPRVDIDDPGRGEAVAGNLNLPSYSEMTAYVMYTSGSTGKPKGVMVTHRAIGRLVLNCGYADFNADDRVAFAANPAFDASTMEVWAPLLNGGRIVVIDQRCLLDPALFGQTLEQQGVSVLWLTAGLFNQYAESLAETFGRLRYLIVGGEALDPQVIAGQLNRCPPQRLVNGYGPTETTTFAITHEIKEVPEGSRSVPLGRPISNTHIYILDTNLQQVAIGMTGELYIGGSGVAQGYLDRPELTADRFLPDYFSLESGARIYKTGDLGRWLPDGKIEFLGRNDFQVKIRGFRIELGEIEARLRERAEVREAVVTACENGEGGKHLVAYYTGEVVEAEALRDHLSFSLPEYMIPSAYVYLETMPLSTNGKLNLRALPAPDSESYVTRGYEQPVGETETRLSLIWANLLNIERVGRYDGFFDLGGHSLLAMRFISQLRQAMGVEALISDLFAHPVLTDFALVVERAARAALPAITPTEREKHLPLSFAQQRLWFLAQLEGVSQAYHISWRAHLKGKLDRWALRRALDRIVARHEALRTTFISDGGEVAQRVAAIEDSRFHLAEHDLRQRVDGRIELDDLMEQEARAAFDLQAGPLIRGRLIQLGDDEHTLLITMHHIVSDGWSMGVLLNELSVLYRAFLDGEADPLPALGLQYIDYAVWQRKWMEGDILRRQAEYWREALAGAPVGLGLPTDHSRPAQQNYAGAFVRVTLDEDLTAGLKELSKRHGTTLFMTLLGGWAALLARLSGQQDIVIGTPTANRRRIEVEELIGFFANTLALHLDFSGSPTVSELLARVKAQALAAQQHQDIPFEQVVEVVRPARSLSYSPIFQVMFAWQNAPEGVLELPGLEVRSSQLAPQVTAKFDLTLSLREAGKTVVGGLEYATSLFEAGTIERYLEYFRTLLEAMVADDGQAVDRLLLLSASERRQVIEEWNETSVEYPAAGSRREKCLHHLFEEQMESTPEAVAVVFEDQQLTYQELNKRANRLAYYLQRLGVGPEARVGICVERSLEMVVGLLGILKAGGAYVPLDPAYPTDRLRYMVEDSAPAALLTQGHHKRRFTGIRNSPHFVDLTGPAVAWSNHPATNSERASTGLTSKHLAYVIYTSGSTGAPKGVAVEHRSLVNLICWSCNTFELKCGQRSSSVAGFGFDAATWEIWPALCAGATLLLPSPMEARDPEALLAWWSDKKPDVSFLPTPIAEFAFTQGITNPLQRILLVGGDHLRHLPPNAPPFLLVNNYGPTEATVVATSGRIKSSATVPSIGRPIANTQVYILDDYQQPVPIGVQGELYIGGAGVGRGYLNRPEQTAEQFVGAPFAEDGGVRMYKTGDLARWLADGTIEFLGRNDFQVKIRGYRIELGEIEANLMERDEVREAVVVAREDTAGDKRLVAYYTSMEGTERGIGAEELRSYLSARLPDYMAPAAYVRLEKLPLTPNGKVDRKALPAPDGDAYVARGYEAPVDETETALACIWADVLKVERVGRYDNFFELGGHSLLATRIVSRIRTTLGIEFSVKVLFEAPTVSEIAERLKRPGTARMPLRPIMP